MKAVKTIVMLGAVTLLASAATAFAAGEMQKAPGGQIQQKAPALSGGRPGGLPRRRDLGRGARVAARRPLRCEIGRAHV